jgi:RNA polymerase sigma factor (sigma-70 family)
VTPKTEHGADDLELLGRYAAQREPQAIQTLIHKHRQMVFATCLRRLRCQADAEDATQEVFLSLMVNAGKVRSNVGAWLRRCALNTSTSMIRTNQKRTHREIEKARLTGPARDDNEAASKERVAILKECLHQLDATDRRLLRQSYVLGRTQEEIAASLGVTQQAVAKRIGKSLVWLRRKLFARGLVLSLVAAVMLLARKVASAAIPHGLKAAITATPSASLASGGTAGAGAVGLAKASAAVVLVLTATVATYECVENRYPQVPDTNAAIGNPASSAGSAAGSMMAVTVPPSNRLTSSSSMALSASSSFNAQASCPPAPTRDPQSASVRNATGIQRAAPILQTQPNYGASTSTPYGYLQDSVIGQGGSLISSKKAAALAKTPANEILATGVIAATAPSLVAVTTDDTGLVGSTGSEDGLADSGQPSAGLPDSSGTRTDGQQNPLLSGGFRFGSRNPGGASLAAVGARTGALPPPMHFQSLRYSSGAAATSSEADGTDGLSMSGEASTSPLGRFVFNGTANSMWTIPKGAVDASRLEEGNQAMDQIPAVLSPGMASAQTRLGTVVYSSSGTTIPAGTTLAADGAVDGRLINQGIVADNGGNTPLYLTGLVSGRGSYLGNVIFTGGFSPGNSPAAVHVDYATLDSGNTLTMELAGLMPGNQYDQLIIDHHLALGGNLDVELLYGFTPHLGNSFTLLNGDFSGRFSGITLPGLGDGLRWNTGDLYTSGSLEVVPEPATLMLLFAGGLSLLRRRVVRPV